MCDGDHYYLNDRNLFGDVMTNEQHVTLIAWLTAIASVEQATQTLSVLSTPVLVQLAKHLDLSRYAISRSNVIDAIVRNTAQARINSNIIRGNT